jgi:hypothetical protein
VTTTPWQGVGQWLAEIRRRERGLEARNTVYGRYTRKADQLTVERIMTEIDAEAIAQLEGVLRAGRGPGGGWYLIHIWSRAKFGELIVAAASRRQQLALGRIEPRQKGDALDPRKIPDGRLDRLIQTHRDLFVVEALRWERQRRQRLQRRELAA